MALSFFTTAIKDVENVGRLLADKTAQALEGGEGKLIETALIDFAKTDLGKVSIDACEYAKTLGLSGTPARDAAKEKLTADLKAAGKDLEVIGQGLLNLFIEIAFNYLDQVVQQLPALIAAGITAAASR